MHDYSSTSMKFPRHGWFQVKTSNLVDLNQLGWLAMDLFGKKSFWWSFKLGLISWVGLATCNFIEILKKKNVGTNLSRIWEEEFLSK